MTITELNVDTADSDTFNTSVTTLYRTAVDRNSHLHAFVLCSSRGIRVLVNKVNIVNVFVYSNSLFRILRKEGRKEMFYLTTHSTHFIYGYMASDLW